MQTWPNLFIAGAPRCGTSSLHSYLSQVPGIFMSRIKEPNYFSRVLIADDHPMVKPIRKEGDYLRLFEAAGGATVIGEASPNYLEDPGAAELIDRTVPGARIIVSLRDPVERLFSHYQMMRNNRPEMGSFMAEFERGLALQHDRSHGVLAPATGMYSGQVRRYREVFGDRLLVLVFEELMADIPGKMREVLGFLGIDCEFGEQKRDAERQYAEARGPLVRYLFGNRFISRAAEALIPFRLRKFIRNALLVKHVPKPEMAADDRSFLARYYADDVQRLEKLLGRQLPWRNFSRPADLESGG